MADGIYLETESLIDGAPLFVILRGRRDALRGSHGKANAKTGAMIQSYIVRADVPPVLAARTGDDASVCGDCPHRPILARETGAARCYVNLAHGPRVVWDAVKRGAYRRVTSWLEAAAYCAGAPVRIGSYGDPGAVPAYLWAMLAHGATERAGYTHRWRDTGADLRGIAMASVDSIDERDEAWALGWATFRVAETVEDGADRARGEARCPASAEAGKRVTCAECPLKCNGASGGRVILDHSPGGIGRKL